MILENQRKYIYIYINESIILHKNESISKKKSKKTFLFKKCLVTRSNWMNIQSNTLLKICTSKIFAANKN